MKQINRGENALIQRDLKKLDATPLLLTEVDSVVAEVIQNGNVIETLSYPSPRLRQGSTPSQVILEIITTISQLFTRGIVELRWTIIGDHAMYTAEGKKTNIIVEQVLDVR
jgi:hypothetical protein